MPKDRGRLIELEDGRTGKVKNSDQPVNGKILVYLDNGDKVLVVPKKLKLIGFYD